MNDENHIPAIPPDDATSPETIASEAAVDPMATADDLAVPVSDLETSMPEMLEATAAQAEPDPVADIVSVEPLAAASQVEPDSELEAIADELQAESDEIPVAEKPPVIIIADEEVALTADKPPVSAAEMPFGKSDAGYTFKLPQPKFVKRANQEASEILDETFEDAHETFQMIAGQVDKLEATIDLTDQQIRAKDWRLEADLTPEKKSAEAPRPPATDKKEAEKRALAEQFQKMEEERRQRDNVHIERMRAEREALEAKMRAERESRQTKVQTEMEATQARLKAEREAKRLEREAYEAQRKGIVPPPAAPQPTPPPLAKPAEPKPSAAPEDKEQRALRNLSKPEPEDGENKPE